MITFLFGTVPSMQEIERKLQTVALSQLPLLIEGESGTGKETLAEQVHQFSRRNGELVRVVCGWGEADLLAAELFGDGRGDGGKLRRAEQGTLLLKHVEMLPRALQQRLLAGLQGLAEREGTSNGHAPVLRLVCTAVEPLEQGVARKEFLTELYFRLAVCRLCLPPLRQRAKDAAELFSVMLARAWPEEAGPVVPAPVPLLKALAGYAWPGNLRELQNFARSYAISTDADQIIAELQHRAATLHLPQEQTAEGPSLKEQVRQSRRQLEAEIILKALERHRWNRRRAARTLKISYRALLYKMKECRLREEVPETGE